MPPKDENSLLKAMIKILSNSENIKNMGKYARHVVETKYSWSTIAQETCKVYEKVKKESKK